MNQNMALSMSTAKSVASSFLACYYNEFVKTDEMLNMAEFYNDSSYVTLADLNEETPSIAHGSREIRSHLSQLDKQLGMRKVEIIIADHTPLPDGSLQIFCQGVMFLRMFRRVFLHAFVLSPVAYRSNTFYIASDYLRFMNSEEEVIPDGAVVLTQSEVAVFVAEEARRREEEARRREEDAQRQQLLEFQQRLRRQKEERMSLPTTGNTTTTAPLPYPKTDSSQPQYDHDHTNISSTHHHHHNLNDNDGNYQQRRVRGEERWGRWNPREEVPFGRGRGEQRPFDRPERGGEQPQFDRPERRGERQWDRGDRQREREREGRRRGDRPERGEEQQRGERQGDRSEVDRRRERGGRRGEDRERHGDRPERGGERQWDRGDRQRERERERERERGEGRRQSDRGENAPHGGQKPYENRPKEPRRDRGKENAPPVKEDLNATIATNNNNNNNNNNNVAKENINAAGEEHTAALSSSMPERGNNAQNDQTWKEKRSRNNAGKQQEDVRKDEKPSRERETSHVRLTSVPKNIKLSMISEVVERLVGEKPKDAYWFGRDSVHAVLEMSGKSVATKILTQNTLKILNHKINVVPFYL